VQVKLSGRAALFQAWVVSEGLFCKEEDIILSRYHTARLGYRFISDYEDSVHEDEKEDALTSEWISGQL
jgi:hypothetical protein